MTLVQGSSGLQSVDFLLTFMDNVVRTAGTELTVLICMGLYLKGGCATNGPSFLDHIVVSSVRSNFPLSDAYEQRCNAFRYGRFEKFEILIVSERQLSYKDCRKPCRFSMMRLSLHVHHLVGARAYRVGDWCQATWKAVGNGANFGVSTERRRSSQV
eukprot:Blabericola_migrator_1__2504@NODE_1703_length_3971_cov_12_704918_g597_i1_p1_GENE_NODE_1703_length_3971_cov_12_704918_g597_i1NODE_1703_length_3971_cov_12_704918_g597_i1_p1_ORF_typecomplete_len157_score3_11_NODE_1703_length_3971_cov_12_704918_g597_i121752645